MPADLRAGYEGISRFVVRIFDRATGKERVVLILRRHELSWKLTDVWLRNFAVNSSYADRQSGGSPRNQNIGNQNKKSSANLPPTKREQNSNEEGGPFVMENPTLPYSDAALQAKIEGTITLYGTVDSEGHIGDLKVLKSLGYGLDESAIQGIENSWKFRPRIVGGNPVSAPITLTIEYRLRK